MSMSNLCSSAHPLRVFIGMQIFAILCPLFLLILPIMVVCWFSAVGFFFVVVWLVWGFFCLFVGFLWVFWCFLWAVFCFFYWLFQNISHEKSSLMHLKNASKIYLLKSYAKPTLVASIFSLGTDRTRSLCTEFRPDTVVISTTHQVKGPFNKGKRILYKYFY